MADPWYSGAQSSLPNGENCSVLIGPFISDTDAKTPVTDLIIDSTNVKVCMNNRQPHALTPDGEANPAWHQSNGFYILDIVAADNTGLQNGQEETLKVMVNVAGALPYVKDFRVRAFSPA